METVYNSPKRQLRDISYEIFIVLLSILSIVNMVLLILPFSPIVIDVVENIEIFISIILLVDFMYRLFTAPSKVQYFFYNWGWMDLLSSLPFRYTRVFRAVRIRHVVRLLRQKGMSSAIIRRLLHERATSALFIIFFLVIIMLEFGAMAILFVEGLSPNANITTAEEAIWWVFVTIATVGYGDFYPVTTSGRLISMTVMILGVTTFTVMTGFLAKSFANSQADELSSDQDDVNSTVAAVQELRDIITEQEQTNKKLKERLHKLERLLVKQTPSA